MSESKLLGLDTLDTGIPAVTRRHERSMDLAEEAFIAKRRGELDTAKRLFIEALTLESSAAESFPPDKQSEPTRSILYRSAASLAYHAELYERAEGLITAGLAGHPPAEIRAELVALQDKIDLYRTINTLETLVNKQAVTTWDEMLLQRVKNVVHTIETRVQGQVLLK